MNLSKSLNDILQYMQNGDVYLAEMNLKEILSKYPNNPEALSLLGIISIHQKKFKKGKDLIKSSLLTKPKQPQAILNLGLAFYQENKFDEAIKYFDQAIEHQSNYVEAYYCKALSFKNTGKLEEAIASFTDALNINPKHFDSIFNLGYLYFDSKNFNQAIIAFEKALKLDLNNIEILNALGHSLNEIFRYDEAINFFNKSLEINPSKEDAFVGIGYSYLKKGDLISALNYYSHGLKINPNNILALNNRANVYYLLENYSMAIEDLDKLIKIEKNFPIAYNTYGNVLTKLRKFGKAKEKFDFSIALDKNSSESFQNRGVMFHEQKKYIEAINDFDVAINLNPNYADAFNSRGASYKFVNNYNAAYRDYSRALELKPNDVEFLSNIADILYVMGDIKEVNNIYIKALEIDNQNPTLNYNYSLHLLTFKIFSEGWKFYDYRKYMPMFKNSFVSNYYELQKRFKPWEGNSGPGKLLILNEQGIGDQILYLSLLDEIQNSNMQITVLIIDKLCNVFQKSFKNINFIPTAKEFSFDEFSNIDFDFYVFMGDLGKFLRNSLDEFKNQPSHYLVSDESRTQNFKNYFYKNKTKTKICGLSWKSQSKYVGEAKSIELKDFFNILNIPELTFLNLQYGDVDMEINSIQKNFGITIEPVNEIDKYNDIDGLVSLIDSCDYIVTTSNVTAHFSGALGKCTFLLVPYSHGKIWYWHEGDDRSIWYPSIKIFRQNIDGTWNGAINLIAEQLKGAIK